jgi:putative colanic acid biosynthesis acetyltransferase WcaF
MNKIDLSQYKYKQTLSAKRIVWYFVSSLFFTNRFIPVNFLKIFLLRLFGAKIGKGVIIKPQANIKYPWLLDIGNHVWIGENVWIDNLAEVKIGGNSCLSQGAMLLTGNHDYKKAGFDLITAGIKLEDGVWIGAKATVCPGVHCGSHSVLAAGSIATKNLEPYSVYQGNPAKLVRKRVITG